MTYKKMMKWQNKPPKGTKKTITMHTNSGFQPSVAFLEKYLKYRQQCEVEKKFLDCES